MPRTGAGAYPAQPSMTMPAISQPVNHQLSQSGPAAISSVQNRRSGPGNAQQPKLGLIGPQGDMSRPAVNSRARQSIPREDGSLGISSVGQPSLSAQQHPGHIPQVRAPITVPPEAHEPNRVGQQTSLGLPTKPTLKRQVSPPLYEKSNRPSSVPASTGQTGGRRPQQIYEQQVSGNGSDHRLSAISMKGPGWAPAHDGPVLRSDSANRRASLPGLAAGAAPWAQYAKLHAGQGQAEGELSAEPMQTTTLARKDSVLGAETDRRLPAKLMNGSRFR